MGEANIVTMMEDFYRELERSALRELFPGTWWQLHSAPRSKRSLGAAFRHSLDS